MRISDWSSDVCSSDVLLAFAFIFAPIAASFVFSFNEDRFPSLPLGGFSMEWYEAVAADPLVWEGRSEEHTSELQSLMRISYAVFCLKKKILIQHMTYPND